MPNKALEGYKALQGLPAEVLYTRDPEECREVLHRAWIDDLVACGNGLAALVFYKPLILRVLGLRSECTESSLNCYNLDDMAFFRLRTRGRIYNTVLGRKSYIITPFTTPYLAVILHYPNRPLSSEVIAVPGAFHTVIDQTSLVDARDPRKKHKKVYGGGSIVLEACGRRNINDIPQCTWLAEIRLAYRGRARLGLAQAGAAIKVLGQVRELVEAGRESEARWLARGFLASLGIETRGKTTDELIAMLDRLHQPHRLAIFEWGININPGLPHELRDRLQRALKVLLRAASVKIRGRKYLAGFSPGSIENSLSTEHFNISPSPPPPGGWEGLSRGDKLIKLGSLRIARLSAAGRPARRMVFYTEAQKRVGAVVARTPPQVTVLSEREAAVTGDTIVEYVSNTHASEAFYRIYLGHSPQGSWRVVFQ